MPQAGRAQYVLRKKPPGQVLASAHAVEREFQVLAALKDTPVPVPTALCLCQDSAVIGTPFYIMEHVQVRLSRVCQPHCMLLQCRSLFSQGTPRVTAINAHTPVFMQAVVYLQTKPVVFFL